VKQLLKQKNHDYWKEPSNITDLHRHCKYTIRKLARKMASLDLGAMLKYHKEPTFENTIALVYRSEVMYQATTDAQKIFKFLSIAYFDNLKVQDIIDNKSIMKEDQVFVAKREIFIKRIITMSKLFCNQYKIFHKDFMFKG